mgnify:CR=1 FL=1
MSVTNGNSAVANFENGGRVLIETAASTYLNILNISGGSMSMEIGRRRVVPFNDRNVIQPPRLGEQLPSKVKMKVKATSAYASGEIMKLLLPIPSNDTAAAIKIHVEIPTYAGASTGIRWTFTKAVVDRPIPFNGGTDFDEWDLNFTDYAEIAEPTAYTSALS